MERQDISIGQRVSLVLPERQPPTFMRSRDIRVHSTVEAMDENGGPPGVRVRLDQSVNGIGECYTTYAELSPA